MNRLNALIYPQRVLSAVLPCKDTDEDHLGRRPHRHQICYSTLILDSLDSRSMRNRHVKALGLQYFCYNNVRTLRWNSRDLQRISLEQVAECWSTLVCEETKQDWKKNHPERLEADNAWPHKITKAPIANNWSWKKKSHDSWGTGQNTQQDLSIEERQINPKTRSSQLGATGTPNHLAISADILVVTARGSSKD